MTEKIEKKQRNNRKVSLRDILILQAIIAVYTLSGVSAKFASGHTFLSEGFILFYGLEILILGIYALLWQQIIKRFDLSVAYANRSMTLLWSLVWAVVFFHEGIQIQNVIGVIVAVSGAVIINWDGN